MTYQAILSSSFLKAVFSGFQEITVHANPNQSWTGCYLYGKNTYMEFFSIDQLDNLNSLSLGHSAIAFSVDRVSDLDILYKKYQTNFLEKTKLQTYPRTFDNNQSIPWFSKLEVIHPPPFRWSNWIMSYHAEYLQYRDNLILSNDMGVSRLQYNKPNYENKLLKDIKEITIKFNHLEGERFLKEISLLNFEVCQSQNQYKFITSDQMKITIHLVDSSLSKLINIVFSLNQKIDMHSEIIGNSELKIIGDTAHWNFD